MRKAYLLAVLSLLLTGCEQENEGVENAIRQVYTKGATQLPSIVISPGWSMDDHGRPAMVYGNHLCPKDIFSIVSEDGCVVIDPADNMVTVRVLTKSTGIQSFQREDWSIERSGKFPNEIFRLKRPDNTYVSEWKGASS